MCKPVIDVHIHIAASDRRDCKVSPRMRNSPAFWYMLARNNVNCAELTTDFDGTIRRNIIGALEGAPSVAKGVLLALDGVCRDGKVSRRSSDYIVSNQYVRDLAREHEKVLFGASVNPMREDAAQELEDCLTGDPPAALLKWIPNSQKLRPDRDVPDWFYERLRDARVPLLCHTGVEYAVPVSALPQNYQLYGNPRYLKRALDIGVTVIAAHCATRFSPLDAYDWLDDLSEMMEEAERNGRWSLYADVSAMCSVFRVGTVDDVLARIPGDRMVMGSDYPIPVDDMPAGLVRDLTVEEAAQVRAISNPIDKNYKQLLAMGFPEEIGTRAADLLNPRALAR